MDTNITSDDPGKVTPLLLMPLGHQYDPTESSIPWKACKSQGWTVEFSTERGSIAIADQYKLTGPLPGWLSASARARAAYAEMTQDPLYQHPLPYADIIPERYDGFILPGGDGLGMRPYLESQVLREKVLRFWKLGKPVGALCHGMLVLARTIDPQTGHSVLYGRKVTATPKSLDRFAYRFDSWLLKRGYIMYPACVADEVQVCLERPEDFSPGPSTFSPYAITDGNLVTARWYLDAEVFAAQFVDLIKSH